MALCFGWIDGLRKRIDGTRYTIRFTRRRAGSNWSLRNIGRIEVLTAQGLMEPEGLAAFEARPRRPVPVASVEILESVRRRIRANPAVEQTFQSLAPWVRKQSVHWVASAKREQTRQRRLQILLDCCTQGTLIPPLRRSRK